MYKILVTTHCGDFTKATVHTIVIDFDNQKAAVDAADLINSSDNKAKEFTRQNAEVLFYLK